MSEISSAVTTAENAKVVAIRSDIDIADTAQITAFGERAQQEVASFADRILAQTRNRELGDTGALLTDIIDKAKGLDPAERRSTASRWSWKSGSISCGAISRYWMGCATRRKPRSAISIPISPPARLSSTTTGADR
jgi:hypothetical protein